MKYTYEKVTFNKLSEAFKAHEESPLYVCHCGKYHKANGRRIYGIVADGECDSLYKKVEVKEPKIHDYDVVNRFRAEAPHLIDLITGFDEFSYTIGGESVICTEEKFNQCVGEMESALWMNDKGINYSAHKSYQINKAHAEALRENMAYDLYCIFIKASRVDCTSYGYFSLNLIGKYLRMLDLGVTVNK